MMLKDLDTMELVSLDEVCTGFPPCMMLSPHSREPPKWSRTRGNSEGEEVDIYKAAALQGIRMAVEADDIQSITRIIHCCATRECTVAAEALEAVFEMCATCAGETERENLKRLCTFRDAGLLPALGDVMRGHIEDASVQAVACMLLAKLCCGCEENREELFRNGIP